MSRAGLSRANLKLIAAICVFVLFTIIGIWISTSGLEDVPGEGAAVALLSGGFVVAGIGPLVLVFVPRDLLWVKRVVFICLFMGQAMWVAAPIVMVASGAGWTDYVGNGRREVPIWALAVLVVSTLCFSIYGAVRVSVKARRSYPPSLQKALPANPCSTQERQSENQ